MMNCLQIIQEKHIINSPELRKTFCEIQEVLSGISDMGMIEVGPARTYTLAEFCNEQFERIQKLDSKLLDFRNLLRETIYDACRYIPLTFIRYPSLKAWYEN